MKSVTIGILSGVGVATGGIVLGLANPAGAAVLWDWSYSAFAGGAAAGSGTFQTTDERADGSFLITDIKGTSENEPITALLPPGHFLTNDNLLFAAAPHSSSLESPQLTSLGVSFSTPTATSNLGNYHNTPGYLLQDFPFAAHNVNFAAARREVPVPEPGSLLGTITFGAIMLGSALRKARHSSP